MLKVTTANSRFACNSTDTSGCEEKLLKGHIKYANIPLIDKRTAQRYLINMLQI